ncbi:uncharacterized protein BDZ99DRAFT_457515 [Mytilinidion resinicola]|uniref:Uncharacterized protein n=1 Tax=Mytilinidion resinicola TaxID=574789 RepID=A0A6A6ZAW3_9PEZI|nr:uncharacterized protein BDZ99DRAFT_457515 [Mytilinidion resinicola]KAF2817839.1 hypothetical protein BDZ99DRAFT_457515 [Mytilinidion resinicola]
MPALTTSALLYVQSVPILLNGIVNLVAPETVAVPGTPKVALHLISILSLSLGVGYIVAAQASAANRRTFMLASVPLRGLAAALFCADGEMGTAVWEGSMAVVNTAAALLL